MSNVPQPNASALLHIGTNVEAEVEQAFNRWCEDHVTENLSLPGFLAVRRFVKVSGYEGAGDNPKYLTLYPGDMLWMGTDGVPENVKPGDVIEVELSGIGVLRNPVVAEGS